MNLEYMELTRRRRISLFLNRRVSSTFALDTSFWRYVIGALWLYSSIAVAISALGMPTGFGVVFDVISGISLNTIALSISSAAIAVLFAIAGLRMPLFTIGSVFYVGGLTYLIFYYSEFGVWGSVIFCVLFVLLAAGSGIVMAWGIANWGRKWLRIVTAMAAGAILVSLLYANFGAAVSLPTFSSSDADEYSMDSGQSNSGSGRSGTIADLSVDPSEFGDIQYDYFTYGSGTDRHRSEFGEEVHVHSQSVDATDYIDDWYWLRQKFWGFNEKELPLNGRVWLPEGEGPFPLLLMVHGNHLMEDFSDEGYGYLGELMASRGIAAISIDENFLNYSVWSGIPDEDMKARAWLLLKHVQQLQSFNEQVDSPFYHKIDFQQIALLGHSRGGQAAAMATDRERWFKEDKNLPETSSYHIRGIVALAPTDTVVDSKLSHLKDVAYLTLHGAKDTDLINFYGNRQYGRITYTGQTEAFKASLYIEDANHSQFNTSWGESDHAFPAGLFLRPKVKLQKSDQRQIAKVYVSAFLETLFRDTKAFDPLFRDYRTGMRLLPETTRYYNQFESGKMRRLTNFEGEDRTALARGITASAVGMSEWVQEEVLDREGKGKGNRAVVLNWDSEGAAYTLHFEEGALHSSEEDRLVFSMANVNWEYPQVEVEAVDQSGIAVRLPLSRFMNVELPPVTDLTWLPGMEPYLNDGKFKHPAEPIFQTYELPIDLFQARDSRLNVRDLAKITFTFVEGPGEIMLDDFGLFQE